MLSISGCETLTRDPFVGKKKGTPHGGDRCVCASGCVCGGGNRCQCAQVEYMSGMCEVYLCAYVCGEFVCVLVLVVVRLAVVENGRGVPFGASRVVRVGRGERMHSAPDRGGGSGVSQQSVCAEEKRTGRACGRGVRRCKIVLSSPSCTSVRARESRVRPNTVDSQVLKIQ